MQKTKFACMTLMVCLFSLTTMSREANAAMSKDPSSEATTVVYFNGVKTSTYFNDGDTFKIKDGVLKGARVRISGFNTLETYGPVHQWEKSSASYLFDVANQATQFAQRGDWNCTSSSERDTYGRVLAVCDDLAIELIRAGLAHAYSIDSTTADQRYLVEQKGAQKAKRGMWKHGVPQFIITSLHSADEKSSSSYNRLISTIDGHTKRWEHHDNYAECESVCFEQDPRSCMVYVPFEHRYGSSRPECLLQ